MAKNIIRITESQLHDIIADSVKNIISENAHDHWSQSEDEYLTRERLPKGWEKRQTLNGETVYYDQDFNEYTKDEYGNFVPIDNGNMSESKLKGRRINEAKSDPMAMAQQIIDEVNKAYHEASNRQGGDSTPLMDKEGNAYGLAGDVRIDKRGYIVFPFTGPSYNPTKIRILSKSGGVIRLLQGDYYTEGWRDASKLLKAIIKDAMRGIKYFEQYDSNWETADSKEEYQQNKQNMKAMNKNIGLKAGHRTEYISKNF